MSSDDEISKLNIDPLQEERENAQRLIDETLLEKYSSKKVILYDPLKHGDLVIINAEIIKNINIRKRIKLDLLKKKKIKLKNI